MLSHLSVLLGALKLGSSLVVFSTAVTASEAAFGLCGMAIGLVPLACEATKGIMSEPVRAEEGS